MVNFSTTILLATVAVCSAGQLLIEDINGGGNCVRTSKKGDKLKMHYTGTLAFDGTQFDSSIGRGPFEFELGAGRVIKGWDQGLSGMCPGDKRILTIPPELGYGDRGAGGVIPGGATLVFEVELLEITNSGKLIIEDLKGGGNCRSPSKKGDKLKMHYTGTLASDGTQFDSSIGRGPFEFELGAGRVIKGWDQGLSGMCPGDKRKLTIPPELGYGDRGAGADIPGGATLVFEVELLEITNSGQLIIEDLKGGGNCRRPSQKGDKLKMHYTGTLASDGTQFDSSIGRGPLEFELGAGRVIKGWDQGLSGMCPGDKRKLTIPPELGYGDRGAGGVIPGGATLVFEVELLKITNSA